MFAQFTQQNIDLWEAWIDLLSPFQTDGGTLYVIGEVYLNNEETQPRFVKRNSAGSNPRVLELKIVPNIASDGDFITEIMYSENLEDANQYKMIKIYAGNELVKTIREIEKLL